MVFEGKTERGIYLGIEINDRKTRNDDVYIFLITRLDKRWLTALLLVF